MALDNGSITLRRFFIKGRCKPSSDPFWISALEKGAFVGRKLELDDENTGWSVMGDELATDFSLANAILGKFVIFSFRRDRIQVPSSLLNLHVKHRVREHLEAEGMDTIGKQQRAEIKEKVLEELVERTPTSIQVVQVMVDTARAEVYLASTSEKVAELMEALFRQSFDLDFQPSNFVAMAHQLLDEIAFEKVLDDPSISIGNPIEIHPEFEDQLEGKLGAGFLTWLLYSLSTGEGDYKSKHQGEVQMALNEYLLLEGEAQGSKQMLLRKGVLSRCAELATSLRIGKLVSKIRVMVGRDGGSEENNETESWSFIIDKQNANLASMKVPKVVEGTESARLLGRLNFIVDMVELMEDLFEAYLKVRYSKEWDPLNEEMRTWVKGLSRAR